MSLTNSENAMSPKDSQRLAFTLTELFVTLSILAIIMGILLPALQYVREIARKVHCENNLHQVGIALANFAARTNRFPEDAKLFRGPQSRVSHPVYGGPFAQIAFDLEVRYSIVQETVVYNNDLSGTPAVLQCPSGPPGLSYRWNFGLVHQGARDASGRATKDDFMGIIRRVPLSLSAVTDGLSNTTAFSEHPPGNELKSINTSFVSSVDAFQIERFDSICESLHLNPRYLVPSTQGNWASPNRTDIMYVHERSPNSALWDCFLVSSLEHCFKITITARSLHNSIVHAAMLDGSIRPISSQIEPRLWSALGGINDSESFIID